DAAAALLGHHPDILDENAARRRPDRVVESVEREADRLAGQLGDQGGELRVLAEAVARQGLRRRGHGIWLVLVGREIDGEFVQELDVVDGRGTYIYLRRQGNPHRPAGWRRSRSSRRRNKGTRPARPALRARRHASSAHGQGTP